MVEKALSGGQPATHKLIVSGREPTPVELFSGHLSNRDDLRTTDEEAAVTMVYQVLNIAQSGVQTIKVISDDTDVLVLLNAFLQQTETVLIMEATSSERASVDIQASVKNCENVVPHLLAAHGLTGCDTVAKLHGIGKGTVIKKLKEGHTLDHLGNLDSSVDEPVMEATKFIGACYGSKSKDDLSEI